MNIGQYQLKSGLELLSYEFISEGPKGLITKRLQFTYFNEISGELEIYGRINDDWHRYEKNKDYQAFIAKLKLLTDENN